MVTKQNIRKNILSLRNELSQAEVSAYSEKIISAFIQTEDYKKSTIVLLYHSFKNEVATNQLFLQCLKDKKQVCFPKTRTFIDKTSTFVYDMDFYYITSMDTMIPGYNGILEPDNMNEQFQLNEMNKNQVVMIVPGAAFDENLHRIGYGKGYYDQYLSKFPIPRKIAFAYDFQILPQIPFEEHDICPDCIITEKRILTGK